MSARRKQKAKSASRRRSFKAGLFLTFALLAYASFAVWFVHHPRAWLETKRTTWPAFLVESLVQTGSQVSDLTDGLALTGHDAVYEYDEEAPFGNVFFAGAPRRTGIPAPRDIVKLDRGDFVIGWSPSLRHPVWCAYHVTPEPRFESGKRPNFTRDPEVPSSPAPGAYERTGYDRGHMAPNHAIETRYGESLQKLTFRMTNIAPQTPALNRGVWRDVEHRIADLWTARYGEIWVIVGCISNTKGETLCGTSIDVPERFYQLIVCQEGLDVRAQAVLFEQSVSARAWAARYLLSIDELEKLTGLDFLPELPRFIQDPLEAELPSRLWPVRIQDLLKQLLLRFN